MFRNYLRIALRNTVKQKGFTFLNVVGLAIGIASCIFIFMFVRHELSYDSYHADNDRIFRVVMDIETKSANRAFAPISFTAAPALAADFPQVEIAARAWPLGSRLVKHGEQRFYEDLVMFTDQSFVNLFQLAFVEGQAATALERPNTVVVSERIAEKYFDSESPLGKTLNINTVDYEITGVVPNVPANTHLKYDFILSLRTLEDRGFLANWHLTMCYTYVKLKPAVDFRSLGEQIRSLANNYVADDLEQFGAKYTYSLQNVKDIHLNSHLRYEAAAPGNSLYIYIFSAVGILILMIACVNFINLTTARSASRAKEVGLRKVVGAVRKQLVGQFIGESMLTFAMALLLALILAWVALPYFNDLTGLSFGLLEFFQPEVLFVLLVLTFLVGVLAGSYPAFFLSVFRPAVILRGPIATSASGAAIRRILVVGQFAISIVLMIATMIAFQQLNFMKNQHLGFNKAQKLVVPFRGGISISDNYEAVKEEFLKAASVVGATASASVPGRGVNNFATRLIGEEDDKNQSMFYVYFDADFIPQYEMEVVAGRAFQKDRSTDITGGFMINEAATKAFGWQSAEQAIGKRLQTGHGGYDNPIIGVVKDFHYRGLQTIVEPLVIEYRPSDFDHLTLTIETGNLSQTLRAVEKTWTRLYPANPFEYFFLDVDFERQYRSEEQAGKLSGTFSVLGIFVACLGLLGLASFTAERRSKEIGIRKVLGASVSGLIFLLTKEFVKWVGFATLLAWPLAFYLGDKWLDNFAYRTNLGWTPFLSAAFLTGLIAIVTVGYQSVKAAFTNPAVTLRYE